MKKYTFLFLLFFAIENSNAQFFGGTPYYLSGELTVGNYFGLDLDLNFLLNEDYSLKLGYSGYVRQPKSAPPDYDSGFLGAMSFGLKNPWDRLGNYRLMAGKIFPLNNRGTIRFNLSVGAGLSVIKEPTNWEALDRGLVYGSYTFDYHSYTVPALILNPKMEFPLWRSYGFSISPMLQINKDRVFYGVGIGQLFGRLRN